MQRFNIRTVTLLAAAMTLNSGCMMAARGEAQHRHPDPTRILASADTNGDGVTTREKFHAARQRLFARLDRNGDGYIDRSDGSGRLTRRHEAQERLAELIGQLDADGDGRVSKAEFDDGPAPLFDRADTDHNGQLSQAEVMAAQQLFHSRR